MTASAACSLVTLLQRLMSAYLTRASVDREEYVEALQVTKAGNVIVVEA